ncbi:thiamine diphosphokinase [Candidatus Gottesmanbacteria bacterium RIFCSPHIGHO2_01_FULL_46_14]|uniref:Thiamine diphosphokinase n=2 Tax=Microgenomates group TaxID=1794810 RepID=A0A1F5ZR64_9BACT|nr:MAG: Thiamine pyrophosphokinase [Candidatus Curtissbacteria bacterium GW2011_GWA1_41_11]OGG14996.1 MAG: thiamine diphosphokinase [Candidatus Gottesmanbacteria bacterium RIFCSPHIGHO2_01_FULL_46_14]
MKITIVANGYLDQDFLRAISAVDLVIGVDRGAYWLLEHGITPQIAIGDFDSTSVHEFSVIKKKIRTIKKFPSEKDHTDLELAIDHAISLHPKEVVIYGASGGRLDHTLAAVELLTKFLAQQIHAVIRDQQNEIFLVSKRHTFPRLKKYQYFSILPFGKQVIVSLRGFKYEASKRTIIQGSTLGISNEIVDKLAIVEIHQGIALVVKSKDK